LHFKNFESISIKWGYIAPNFDAVSTVGKINFYHFLGDSWGVMFSHPADYTPVCTTELGSTAVLQQEFEKRNVKVLALSV
jgi:thioredoxin-dependent peroxiredoxin